MPAVFFSVFAIEPLVYGVRANTNRKIFFLHPSSDFIGRPQFFQFLHDSLLEFRMRLNFHACPLAPGALLFGIFFSPAGIAAPCCSVVSSQFAGDGAWVDAQHFSNVFLGVSIAIQGMNSVAMSLAQMRK